MLTGYRLARSAISVSRDLHDKLATREGDLVSCLETHLIAFFYSLYSVTAFPFEAPESLAKRASSNLFFTTSDQDTLKRHLGLQVVRWSREKASLMSQAVEPLIDLR